MGLSQWKRPPIVEILKIWIVTFFNCLRTGMLEPILGSANQWAHLILLSQSYYNKVACVMENLLRWWKLIPLRKLFLSMKQEFPSNWHFHADVFQVPGRKCTYLRMHYENKHKTHPTVITNIFLMIDTISITIRNRKKNVAQLYISFLLKIIILKS